MPWLVMVPVVFFIAFIAGQIALNEGYAVEDVDTSSKLQADYGPWNYVVFHSVDPEIMEEIGGKAPGANSNLIPGFFWNPTAIMQAPASEPDADVSPDHGSPSPEGSSLNPAMGGVFAGKGKSPKHILPRDLGKQGETLDSKPGNRWGQDKLQPTPHPTEEEIL